MQWELEFLQQCFFPSSVAQYHLIHVPLLQIGGVVRLDSGTSEVAWYVAILGLECT